jgi:Spy/CpxP family protein refolding chaperone
MPPSGNESGEQRPNPPIEVPAMRLTRILAGLALLTALALLGAGDTRSQDKDKEKAKSGAEKKAAGPLPKYWDELGLTDAQRAEVVKLTREQKHKVDKLREEIKKLEEEYARKRVAVLSDEQRKKLIDLVAGPEPKDKADPKAKAKDK